MTLENINPVVETEELAIQDVNADADLFADELEEHINNVAAIAPSTLSTIGTVSSAGSYCTISTLC